MLRLRYKSSSPPGGLYFYEVPETGAYFERPVFDQLVFLIRDHYTANSIAIPENLAALIENFMCLRMPASVCTGTMEPDAKVFRAVTVPQIRDYTRLLFEKATNPGTFFVSPEEAERRAGICANCPLNAKAICTTCNGLKKYAAKFLANRKTSWDTQLGVCALCGCMLQAKVHVSKEALALTQDHDYPPNCWLRKGS